MSLTVELPEDVAARVQAVAADRGVSVDQVVTEAVKAQLPADDTAVDQRARDDAFNAFIGCGASGDPGPHDIHELRRTLAERKYAEDLAKRRPEGI